jgi:hypothetical protein
MTCLKVSSNIHPISAPTGTDEDMGGNDKADALVGLTWNGRGKNWKLKRNCSQIRTIQPELVIYDTSPRQMHLRGTRKTRGVT